LLLSCESEKSDCYTWNLDNEVLKNAILNYIDSVNVPNDKDKFVLISFQFVNDSTNIYTLGYFYSSFGLSYMSPQLFFYVNENLVGLYIVGLDDFSLDYVSIIDIMKSKFPKQYEYYLDVGDYPPPMTVRDIFWELTFQNGELIKKEVIE